jgi:hypothetical protein
MLAARAWRMPALVLACALGAGLAGCATREAPVVAAPNPEEALNARGVQLRQAIQSSYELLGRSGGVDRQNGNDIMPTVARFIPQGTSFDDAETILRDAGFTVGQRPAPQGAEAAPADSEVRAVIDPFMPPLVCHTTVEVRLQPQAPFDYRVVMGMSARFATVCL